MKLKTHLRLWERQNFINLWTDMDISPGRNWREEITHHLNSARIVLLLVSPDFLASDYCYSTEMTYAMQRYERGEVLVVPIILRSCAWEEAPFGRLQVLPTSTKPVMSSRGRNQDEAFTDVVKGLRKLIESFEHKDASHLLSSPNLATRVSQKAIIHPSHSLSVIWGAVGGAVLIVLIGVIPIFFWFSVINTNKQSSTSSSVHATIEPGGTWIIPGDNFSITQGQTLQLSVHAYPTKNGDPEIAYVEFTGYWNGLPSPHWPVLQRVYPTIGTDIFSYAWDLTYQGKPVPRGEFRVSFDVYDIAGNRNLAPNGVHSGLLT